MQLSALIKVTVYWLAALAEKLSGQTGLQTVQNISNYSYERYKHCEQIHFK